MQPTRVRPPRSQFFSLYLSVFGCVFFGRELYLVYNCAHPTLTPRLANAGIWPHDISPATPKKRVGAPPSDKDDKGDYMSWVNINGVPVPLLDIVARGWRKE